MYLLLTNYYCCWSPVPVRPLLLWCLSPTSSQSNACLRWLPAHSNQLLCGRHVSCSVGTFSFCLPLCRFPYPSLRWRAGCFLYPPLSPGLLTLRSFVPVSRPLISSSLLPWLPFVICAALVRAQTSLPLSHLLPLSLLVLGQPGPRP